jgi:hypothetical protein
MATDITTLQVASEANTQALFNISSNSAGHVK